jgi:F-type H+-transporting ATPase subunit c
MTITPSFIHYLTVAICTMITGFSVSIGQGITGRASFDALNRQPSARADLFRATMLALALIETASLLGFLGSILIFLYKVPPFYTALAEIGMACAIALPSIVIGIASALPAQEALMSIARQPFLAKKITNLMLLTQSLIQTPLVFGFIVALIIRAQLSTVTTLNQALALIASGLCVGLGSIGPALGVGHFIKTACKSAGINSLAYSKVLSFTVISQAIIETPVIFSTIIAFWLIRLATSPSTTTGIGLIYLAVAFVMAIGTLGPGISSGRTAASACTQIASKPQIYSTLTRISIIAQGIIDTCTIYAFIIALSLILVTTK